MSSSSYETPKYGVELSSHFILGLSKTWCQRYLDEPKQIPASYGIGSA